MKKRGGTLLKRETFKGLLEIKGNVDLAILVILGSPVPVIVRRQAPQ
ncbi:MAG: hypothetical protein GTN81_16465 [Proteobacteria bacterium]|nr:hypothetical protein [Pseudomonadota bacterium]